MLTPFALALAKISSAKGIRSSSQMEVPMVPPCALKKVYAIPPPIIISVARSNKFSIIKILSDTLAPPIIAVKGFSEPCKTFSALATSAFMTRPNILLPGAKNCAITAVEACARCAVPNASFTYTSPRVLSFCAKASSPFSSSL